MAINRFDVYLVRLDPTVGSERAQNSPQPRSLAE